MTTNTRTRIDYDAQDWMLYTTVDGSDECATRLNTVANIATDLLPMEQAFDVLVGTMAYEGEFGAGDSEPRGVVSRLFIELYGDAAKSIDEVAHRVFKDGWYEMQRTTEQRDADTQVAIKALGDAAAAAGRNDELLVTHRAR